MTNEELVKRIQSGERDRLPELWEQVRRLVLKYAVRGRYWRGEQVSRHHITRALARLRHPSVSKQLRACMQA